MKLNRTISALFVAVLTFPIMATGQDEKASNDETIDNIVVVGQKSLSELRRDVFKAEEDFYSVYNKLNDEKDYAVRCFYETPTGTRQKNHVCRARFVTKAYSGHAARNGNDLSRVANQDANSTFAKKTVKYQENLESLVAASPELQDALVRYNTARADFFAEREQSASN